MDAPLNRFPRMVQDYIVDQVRLVNQRRSREAAKLKTRQDAEKYIEHVTLKIRDCFGPEPERTPLNPRITGIVQRDTYQIEKLIFDSRPGFSVTANLYVPKGNTGPMPAVVGTCGHSANGKAAPPYQSFAQGLARQGYVCLIYDPIGQGERSQYVDENLKPTMQGSVDEHLHAGNQQFLVGEYFGAWCAWDGIRALDYLLTRPEVDPDRIGVTGNSGGGTITTWLCGLDSRWSMAAPACFVTTFLRNLENELPADTEQCPPREIALGLDHVDFLAAMAPRPIIILAKERDYFDVRGAQEAYGRLKHLYELLGKGDQVKLFVGPTDHGYSQENREAMYGWFNQVTKVSDAKSEPELRIETDETLWCTPQGQLAGPGVKTVFDFTRERSQSLAQSRKTLDNATLIQSVKNLLKLPIPKPEPPEFRILRTATPRQYPLPRSVSYAVETDRDVFAVVYMLGEIQWLSRPPQDGKRALLYVSHRSSDNELRNEPLIKTLLGEEPNSRLFTCDVRGIGESMPNTCAPKSFDDPYGSDYFYAIHSLMLDRPYLGQKTYDVLRVIDFLAAHGCRDVHLVGVGWGALAATFAALISDRVSQVTLKDALTSYQDLAENEQYTWPLATLLPSVLAHFDLPDCYRVLQAKRLRMV